MSLRQRSFKCDRIWRTYPESIDQLLMTTAKHSKWWPNVNKDG